MKNDRDDNIEPLQEDSDKTSLVFLLILVLGIPLVGILLSILRAK
jgi:hypothetical protein